MSLATSRSVALGSICEGCLSVDRKLTPIYGEESKEFHCILESTNHISHITLLCWECVAILRRTLRFREQVKGARDCLVGYMLHQTTLTPFSHLNITANSITHHIEYKAGLISEDLKGTEECKVLDFTGERERTHEISLQIDKPNDIQPVTFIKVEDRDDYDDGLYIDDAEEADDKDIKVVFKSDDAYAPVKRRRKRKAKEYNFDDSDDEPLKKKADQKREKTSGPKRRATREKPPGVVNNARVENVLRRLNVPAGLLEMVVLSWEEIDAERTKALSSDAFTRHQYRCYGCVLGFNHRAKLEAHMRKHDVSAGPHTCSVCTVRCKDAHSLCAHRRRHRVRWRCTTCGASFSRAPVCADHAARAHHARAPRHTCAVCGDTATTLGKLRNHLKSHAEKQNCELCGKSFRDRGSLRTHLFIHRGEKEYVCEQCDKRFLFKKALEVHMVTHDAPLHLYCHQCDMNFKNRMSFYQHMKYNLKHIDPAKLKHACSTCGKRFSKSSRLREHHVAVHLRHTPVPCAQPGCSFACASRPVLRTHMRMVHRGARALRNHVCHTCGKAYTTKKTLEGHLRSHSGERPFRCAQCPAAFGYEAALYNHNKLVHRVQPVRKRAPAAAPAPTAEALPWLPSDGAQQEPTDVQVTGEVT